MFFSPKTSASSELRPVTSFTRLRRDAVPPIQAITQNYHIHPAVLLESRTPPPVLPSYRPVPRFFPKTDKSKGLGHLRSVHAQPPRKTLQVVSPRVRRSTGALQHNKELNYNVKSPRSPRIKDIEWQRALRQSPFMWSASWKQEDESLLAQQVHAGRLRLFLHEGASVLNGKAQVSVGYQYCRSCRGQPIVVQVGNG